MYYISLSTSGCLTHLVLCLWAGLARSQGESTCLVNVKLGFSDPKNVYTCKFPQNCCLQYSKPSCCGSKPSWQIVQEQVTLWGGLFGILFILASIVYCRKNDVRLPFCSAFKLCLVNCCFGNENREDEDNSGTLKTNTASIPLKVIDKPAVNGNSKPSFGKWRMIKNTVTPIDSKGEPHEFSVSNV